MFAVAADGSMHVQVLDGYLDNTHGNVLSVQVKQSVYVLWQGGLIKMSNILGPRELKIKPLDPCPVQISKYAGRIKDEVILTFDQGGGNAYNIKKRKWHDKRIPPCDWYPWRNSCSLCVAGNFIFIYGGSSLMDRYKDLKCLEIKLDP